MRKLAIFEPLIYTIRLITLMHHIVTNALGNEIPTISSTSSAGVSGSHILSLSNNNNTPDRSVINFTSPNLAQKSNSTG